MTDNKPFTNPVLSLEDLPSLDTIEYQGLSRNYFYARLIGAVIVLAWVTFIYFMLAYLLREDIPLWIRQTAPWVLVAWWLFSLFRVYKIYNKKAFALRGRDVHYKTGWIWKKEVTLPYNRIQHCELSSGPIDRLFELTELHIYTAGGSQSDMTIPGLEEHVGRRVKGLILKKIGGDEEE